jgi:hypothetical protein
MVRLALSGCWYIRPHAESRHRVNKDLPPRLLGLWVLGVKTMYCKEAELIGWQSAKGIAPEPESYHVNSGEQTNLTWLTTSRLMWDQAPQY